jgi:hypothetical protein
MNLFCRPEDPILNLLHSILNANLVRIPDGRLAPLMVLELSAQKHLKLRTLLPHILSFPTEVDLNERLFETKPLASISGEKTTRTDAGLGLKILNGFLQGFGASLPNLNFHFKDATKVSFSFESVMTTWVDNGLLGKSLSNQTINKNNPMTAGFFANPPSTLLVIDSIITSAHFSMCVEESTHDEFEIDFEALKKELGQAKTKLEAFESGKRTVTFRGTNPLPFAYTCIRLELNGQGKIVAMPGFKPRYRAINFESDSTPDFEKFRISNDIALLDLDD